MPIVLTKWFSQHCPAPIIKFVIPCRVLSVISLEVLVNPLNIYILQLINYPLEF